MAAKKRIPHDRLRPKIVDLAENLVAEEGLASLTARRIADLAGVSVGTVYNLFGHLDGVVRAVNLRSMAELQTRLTDAVEKAGTQAEPALLALAEGYFDYAMAHPNLWEALFRYRATTPGDGQVMAAEAELFALLRRAAGEAAPDEALRTLWAAVHGVVELTISQAARDVEMDGRAHVRLVVMAGLRGVAALRSEGLL